MPKSASEEPEAPPTEPAEPTETHNQWPALDIQVQDFRLADKALGQLTLLARQRPDAQGRYWALERFQLLTPDTRWRAARR